MKNVLLRIVIYPILIVIVLVIMLRVFEDRLIFFAEKDFIVTPQNFGMKFDEVWLQTDDGVKIHSWWIGRPDAKKTILFLHGNAGNISHRIDRVNAWRELPVNFLLVDYRGYGMSQGEPTEEGVYEDAKAAYEYLVNQKKISPESIIVFGESLGGAVAIHLASNNPVGGLVVESSFTSLKDIAAKVYPFIPSFLVSDKFNSKDKITLVGAPVLVVHGESDDLIPFEMGKTLYNASTSKKAFYPVEKAGHNDVYVVAGKHYVHHLRRLIDEN